MKLIRFLIACAFWAFAAHGNTQTTTSKKVIVKETLILTGDTLTDVIKTISNASTHFQTPTGKAVYNYIQSLGYLSSVSRTSRLSGSGTSGSPLDIAQNGATSGQVMKWNGTAWAPADEAGGAPSGTAGGDLTGTYPNPSVDALQGRPVDNAAPSTGQVMKWNGSAWAPGTDNSGGGGGTSNTWTIQTTAPTGVDTVKTWVNLSENDGTGIYATYRYIYGAWRKIGEYDRVQNAFSTKGARYIVITGQSNATPRVGQTSNPADTVPSRFSCIWNGQVNAWQRPMSASYFWMNGNQSLPNRGAWWGLILGQMAEREGYLTRIVYAGRGGQTISNWISPGGTQWDTLSARITASNIPRIDEVIWYQGETDGWTFRSQKQYSQDWFTVMAQLQALPQWRKNTRVFACQINTGLSLPAGETLWPGERPNGEMSNYVFNQFNTDRFDWTNVVRNDDGVVQGDSSHIDANSHVTLGRRLWNAIMGRAEWKPDADFGRFVANGDTVALNFSYSNYAVQRTATTNTVIQSLLGWQNGKTVSININPPSLSAKTIAPNGQMFCQNLLGDMVEIDTIWGRYAATGWLRNDTLLLSQCPANFKATVEYPLSLSPYFWLDASKETEYTANQQVDTLHDFSGNNRHFNAPLVNRGPTWKINAQGGKPSFKFSPTISDTTTAKWAVRSGTDMSFLHKDSATVFIIVKVADTAPPDGSFSGIFGGTVGSGQRGYSIYYDRAPSNNKITNLISNGSNLVVSNANSASNYYIGNFSMIGVTTDPENATASQRSRTYFGNLGPYASNTQSNALSVTNTNTFVIGRTNTGNHSFVGEICEVVAYNKVLSALQIASMKQYFSLKYNISL